MITIEQIKTDKGSWEKTARALYLLLDEISDKHPETGALIAKSLHTESAPKNKPGRKSFVFKGQVKSGKTGIGWAGIALIIRNSEIDGIKTNQEAAKRVWSRLV